MSTYTTRDKSPERVAWETPYFDVRDALEMSGELRRRYGKQVRTSLREDLDGTHQLGIDAPLEIALAEGYRPPVEPTCDAVVVERAGEMYRWKCPACGESGERTTLRAAKADAYEHATLAAIDADAELIR